MASDAFIGVLTGLSTAHRARQKNIFDQEVERRSKYEKLLQDRSTDPRFRPESQDELTALYSELVQTPYEKKLPKDFERRVMDALTSVEGQVDLRQGGPPQTMNVPEPTSPPQFGEFKQPSEQVGRARESARLVQGIEPETVQEPGLFRGRVPSRFSSQEESSRKIAEAAQMLQALAPLQRREAVETARQIEALKPEPVELARRMAGMQNKSRLELEHGLTPILKERQPTAAEEVERARLVAEAQRSVTDSPEALAAFESRERVKAKYSSPSAFDQQLALFRNNPTEFYKFMSRNPEAGADLLAGYEPQQISMEDTLYNRIGWFSTGPFSVLTGTLGRLTGTASYSRATIQAFANSKNTLIRALAENPRFAVAEANRLAEEINIQPNWWDAAGDVRTRMKEIDKHLQTIIQRRKTMGDTAAVLAIQEFRNKMGAPQSDVVRVVGPDGVTGTVPSAQWELEEWPGWRRLD